MSGLGVTIASLCRAPPFPRRPFSVAAGAGDGDDQDTGLVGLVPPGVPGAVLDQDVAGLQQVKQAGMSCATWARRSRELVMTASV